MLMSVSGARRRWQAGAGVKVPSRRRARRPPPFTGRFRRPFILDAGGARHQPSMHVRWAPFGPKLVRNLVLILR